MRKASRFAPTVSSLTRWVALGVWLLCGLFTLSGTSHAAQLTISWTDASTNEDGFRLERATGTAGAYGLLATVAADASGYVDSAVTAGTTYCYRVRAYNSAGDSAYSNAACAAPASATLYTVTAGKSGSGNGTVTSSPPGIACGSDCSESIASGTSLVLSASATAGSTFAGWSGACTGTGSCLVVVAGNTSVTAAFTLTPPTTYTLSLSKNGTGSGTITSSPAGISCGSDCSEAYASGTKVTLTAGALAGSTFTGWSGACTGTATTCEVTLTAARSVAAGFAPNASTSYALTVKKLGRGQGTIVSTPNGLYCGSTCSATFAGGTTVTLAAVTTSRSTFTGWSGACSGSGETCTVTMTEAQSVTATFARTRYWRWAAAGR